LHKRGTDFDFIQLLSMESSIWLDTRKPKSSGVCTICKRVLHRQLRDSMTCRILRRIPKASRLVAAEKMSQLLSVIVANSSHVQGWIDLLLFPSRCLHIFRVDEPVDSTKNPWWENLTKSFVCIQMGQQAWWTSTAIDDRSQPDKKLKTNERSKNEWRLGCQRCWRMATWRVPHG